MLHWDLLLFTAFKVCVSVAVKAPIQYYSQIATKKCVCVCIAWEIDLRIMTEKYEFIFL